MRGATEKLYTPTWERYMYVCLCSIICFFLPSYPLSILLFPFEFDSCVFDPTMIPVEGLLRPTPRSGRITIRGGRNDWDWTGQGQATWLIEGDALIICY